MAHVRERLLVHCPNNEAARYLADFVTEHKTRDGTVRVALHLPISKRADRRPLNDRPVVATLYPLQSITDRHSTYSVTWLPKGDGPSPEFAGALAVEESLREDCFRLILSGNCESATATPNQKRGRRVARTSAREVLRAIAAHIENAYAHDQAAIAGHRPFTDRSFITGIHSDFAEMKWPPGRLESEPAAGSSSRLSPSPSESTRVPIPAGTQHAHASVLKERRFRAP